MICQKNMHYICIACKNHTRIYFKKCKYRTKRIQMSKTLNTEVKLDSDADSESSDSDSESSDSNSESSGSDSESSDSDSKSLDSDSESSDSDSESSYSNSESSDSDSDSSDSDSEPLDSDSESSDSDSESSDLDSDSDIGNLCFSSSVNYNYILKCIFWVRNLNVHLCFGCWLVWLLLYSFMVAE